MQKFDGILEEVIVEVLVKMEQEVHADLLGIHQLLNSHSALLDVAVGVVALHHGRAVPAREKEVVGEAG
jgi:hypothetical protein